MFKKAQSPCSLCGLSPPGPFPSLCPASSSCPAGSFPTSPTTFPAFSHLRVAQGQTICLILGTLHICVFLPGSKLHASASAAIPPIPSGLTWSTQPGVACGRPQGTLHQPLLCPGLLSALAGSAEQSHPLASSLRTTNWLCFLGRIMASAVGASQPPTRPSMPQTVGAPG